MRNYSDLNKKISLVLFSGLLACLITLLISFNGSFLILLGLAVIVIYLPFILNAGSSLTNDIKFQSVSIIFCLFILIIPPLAFPFFYDSESIFFSIFGISLSIYAVINWSNKPQILFSINLVGFYLLIFTLISFILSKS